MSFYKNTFMYYKLVNMKEIVDNVLQNNRLFNWQHLLRLE